MGLILSYIYTYIACSFSSRCSYRNDKDELEAARQKHDETGKKE